MLGWLLVVVALAVLFVYPGLGGLVVVAGAILWYLMSGYRFRDSGPTDGEEP